MTLLEPAVPSPPCVHARVDEGIGWMVFDNTARMNAMTLHMWSSIPVIVERFESDASVRVVVMTGAGDRAFVSGADISEFEEQRASAQAQVNYDAAGERAFASLKGMAKPLIARIDGHCVGGGLALALACDLRLASERSRFAIPAARLGLGYGYEGIKKLVDVVGRAAALEIMLTAHPFGAVRAREMQLVNQVFAADALDESVLRIARQCVSNAPLTMAAVKLAVDAACALPGEQDLQAVEQAVQRCFASEDYVEGRRAFMAKRVPRFVGR